MGADGTLLLQSQGFGSPKDAGQAIARLVQGGDQALDGLRDQLQPVDVATAPALAAALAQLAPAPEADDNSVAGEEDPGAALDLPPQA